MVGRDVTIRYVGDSASAERAAARVRGANDKIKEGFAGVADSASRNFRKVGSSLTSAGRSITTFATLPIAGGFALAIKAASDLNEQASKMKVVFGDQADVIEEFASHAAKNIGLSKKAAFEATGTFGNMFNQLGFGAHEVTAFSQSLTVMAADLASFHNADITQVIEAQTAAFRGEYDSLQRFIPTINAAAVQQKAMAQTGKENAAQLTAGEKAAATYTLMMEGMGKAQNDFARTSDSAANRQRILTAQFQDLAATIGEKLLPIAVQFGEVLAKVLNWFNHLSPQVQKFILIGAALLAVMGPVVGALGALATVIGLVLTPVGLVIIALAALVAGVIYAYQNFEGFRNVVNGVIDWFTGTAVPAFQSAADFIMQKYEQLRVWWAETWPQISEAVRHALNVIRDVITVVTAIVTTLWTAFGETILAHAQRIWQLIYAVISSFIAQVRGIIKLFLAIINGEWGQAWQAIKDILKAKWDLIFAVVKAGVTLVRDLLKLAWTGIKNAAAAAWNGIKAGIAAVWSGIVRTVTGGVNAVISVINGLISGVNWVLRKLKIPEIGKIGKLNTPNPGGTTGGGSRGSGGNPGDIPPQIAHWAGQGGGRGGRSPLKAGQQGSGLGDLPGAGLVKGALDAIGDKVSGFGGFLRRGILKAGFGGVNSAAKAALGAVPNFFGIRDIAQALRERIYNWVIGQDNKLPTDAPSGGGGGGSAKGLVGFAAQFMHYWKARYPWMTIGGWRARGSVPGSDHPKGKALDLMTGSNAIHEEIIRTFVGQAGAKYWISMRRFASAATGWKPRGYSGPSPHTDHVHLSYFKNGGMVGETGPAFVHRGENVLSVNQNLQIVSLLGALFRETARHANISFAGHAGTHAGLRSIRLAIRPVSQKVLDKMLSPSEILRRSIGIPQLVGRFQGGTDFVPRTGLALVHRGEIITPSGRRGSPLVVIENLTINASTEAGGRAAGRAFTDVLAQRRVMTDARIS